MSSIRCIKMDIARYGGWRAFLKEQSLWAVLWFRIGSMVYESELPLKRLILVPWWIIFRMIEVLVGVSIPVGVKAGGGLRVWHFGGVFINSAVVLGENCTLRQGVTLGNRRSGSDSPVVGDNVEFGAYAQVLGRVRIGDGARIGALSLVLDDVPSGATAVGIPARVVDGRYTKGAE
jgi:serine O-acetyltransferase